MKTNWKVVGTYSNAYGIKIWLEKYIAENNLTPRSIGSVSLTTSPHNPGFAITLRHTVGSESNPDSKYLVSVIEGPTVSEFHEGITAAILDTKGNLEHDAEAYGQGGHIWIGIFAP